MIQWYQRSAFHRRFFVPRQRIVGFYTIEIMLSLVLGSIVIAVLLSLTFAGWRTYLTSMSYANTNDSSRASFIFLDRQFSLAGYRALMWETPEAVFPAITTGSLYPAFRVGQVIAAIPDPAGSGSVNHRNVILYARKQGGFQDDYDATGALLSPLPWASSLTSDVVMTDCLGERIPHKVVIIERYRIDRGMLVCSRVFVDATSPPYYAASTQEVAILNYVFAMRAAFGTRDNSDPEGQVQIYRNLQQMSTGSSTAQAARWLNIVNIQLDILILRGNGSDGEGKVISNHLGRGNINLVGHNNVPIPAGVNFATVESRVINLKNRAY